ncbi:hypothetical protein PNEG_00685 [Pneumocystis murina B123]|uniref:Ribosomal protein S14 n=1 Tax=Pneumocystis murina (strain B123) TaxID=1069680 RepID=M7NVC2_PNEMU|nr:hypothetical protein PNEG_00685 [Pneumocystis murina B123]EMR11086.1 hypothetical protein PNEG_00685 [Pneumocystis murina B123]
MKCRVLRDFRRRIAVAQAEPLRQALRYIVRNTTLPAQVRIRAQQRLIEMPSDTRTTRVKNRCIESGKGRGIFRDFRLCRYQFRLNALEGYLPGVQKASW